MERKDFGEMAESMKDYERELERSFRHIEVGDIITGMVLSVSETEVILDLNYYTQGIIKVENLSNEPGFVAAERICPEEVIEAMVISLDDGHGNIELSMKEADDVLAWDKLKKAMKDGTVVKVKVKEAVKGGVVAYIEGMRAFIPASQIASDYVENTAEWVGRLLDVKVTSVDQARERVVLSGKAVAREKEAEARNHKISMLVPGTIMEGTVETLQPYGAFVSLGNGLSGLVHISQICQKRIKHPKEVLKEGQKVKVKILNTNDNKISLSMKAIEEERIDEEEQIQVEEYSDGESVSTSLGSLFAKIKLK